MEPLRSGRFRRFPQSPAQPTDRMGSSWRKEPLAEKRRLEFIGTKASTRASRSAYRAKPVADSNCLAISLAKIPANIPFEAKQKQNEISFHRESLDPDRVHQLICIQ